ncbi:MAG: archease [Elusimicrobia bacterium]|nr:archease [Elusimicrobiota bacterium]
MTSEPGFRIVPHTAEVAVEIRGSTWSEFYLNAARGLRAAYGPEGTPATLEPRRIEASGDSAEETLVAWLNELIFVVAAERWFPEEIRIERAEETAVAAEARGGPMGSGEGRAVRVVGEIKSATFSDLSIVRGPDGFKATVVLDV